MQAVDRLHRETLEQALLHHHPAAALVFFGRLEDQHHGAVKASGFGQVLGSPQQHGGVAVSAPWGAPQAANTGDAVPTSWRRVVITRSCCSSPNSGKIGRLSTSTQRRSVTGRLPGP